MYPWNYNLFRKLWMNQNQQLNLEFLKLEFFEIIYSMTFLTVLLESASEGLYQTISIIIII